MREATAERTLPHNLEAERSVLGAILLDNHAFNTAAELIVASDCFGGAHRAIFESMASLSERSEAIDPVTLREELERRDTLQLAGGSSYLASLVDGLPRVVNVEHYARIVKDKASLRALITSANSIIGKALDASEDTDDILDEAERSILEISENKVRRGFVSVRDLALETMSEVERLHERGDFITGLPTGFERLNALTAGFQPGDLIIVAGRPSMGKTAFALNVAQNAALQHSASIGIFSLEMSSQQLIRRLMTARAMVDAHKVATGFISQEETNKLLSALADFSEAKIFIDDSAALTVLEMRSKARRLKLEHGLDLLIIDYLQLMRSSGRVENRNLEIGAISRSLKALAKELEAPVVALSQLSRAPEARSGHRPQLSDLRESGNLEQDADVVAFIFREEVYNPDPELEGAAQLIIAKQRNGPTGDVPLAFLKPYTLFKDRADIDEY